VIRAVRRAGALLLGLLLAAPAAAQGPRAEEGAFLRGEHEGRGYRLFVPPRAEAGAPLVLALHGCWQTPEDFALGTRLNDAARRRGLVVLYPAQGRFHNPYRCWNWFLPEHQTATAGEPGWLLALARRVQAEHGLGEARLLALGFSAGAYMAVTLACVAPHRLAGVGALAGGPFRCAGSAEGAIQCMRGFPEREPAVAAAACRVASGGRPPDLRVSLWHGALDAVVSAKNLVALEAMFARVLGTVESETLASPGAVSAVHRTAAGTPVLETWLVTGMGHAWSGGDARATHTWPPGPAATERMLDFLLSAPGGARRPGRPAPPARP
jgi:poly(hydroxyalkanoate) depolymerase family esterase